MGTLTIKFPYLKGFSVIFYILSNLKNTIFRSNMGTFYFSCEYKYIFNLKLLYPIL